MSLIVSEIFGPTFQGEGPALGQPCGFLRLMACNLSCSWCDTPYTWDASRFDLKAEGTAMEAGEIAEKLLAMPVDLIVISGGEPLLHQKRDSWVELLDGITEWMPVHVETNGTIYPNLETLSRVSLFVVSPKLSHAGDPVGKRLNPAALELFSELADEHRAAFKFVASKPEDLDEIALLTDIYDIPARRVWVMPEGTKSAALETNLAAIANGTLERRWNLTTRLHVFTWGNKRGI